MGDEEEFEKENIDMSIAILWRFVKASVSIAQFLDPYHKQRKENQSPARILSQSAIMAESRVYEKAPPIYESEDVEVLPLPEWR